jgi:hypothetical protein
MRRNMRGESASGGELKTSGKALRKGAGPCRTVMPRSMRKPRIWLMMAVRWRTRRERTVERQQVALLGRLDRNEAHGGPLHGLGDRLGIAVIAY